MGNRTIKWEYKIISCALKKELNDLGALGWEAVGFSDRMVLLKRVVE